MTIRISDRAHQELLNMEARDGIPPAIRARKWILDEIQRSIPPAIAKKMELGLDKPSSDTATGKPSQISRSSNAKRKK